MIKKYIIPKEILYLPLSKASLSEEDLAMALKEMLLICPDKRKVWGYKTYVKLFSISTGRFKYLFRILSFLMRIPLISTLGRYIYKFIASNRNTCSLDTNSSCNL